MFEELDQMNAEMAALKKTHLEKSKELFTKVTKKLFESHPTLESFSWTQYTPYFNDGETCEFGINSDYPKINDSDYDSDVFNEKIIDYGPYDNATRSYPKRTETINPGYDPSLSKAKEDVVKFLSSVDENVLKDMFGDHVEVKVTRDGTDTEEYEHD